MSPNNRAKQRRGFTLVEVMIVVVILGILAATVLPQFTAANEDAKESALVQDLQLLRSQIQSYKFQHSGIYPGQNVDGTAGTAKNFENAMLLSSQEDGTTGVIGSLPLGPYLIGSLPPNPLNGLRTISIVADITTAVDDTTGWMYNPTTAQIKANTAGTAADGRNYDKL